VADAREKRRLGPIELRKGLGAPVFVLEGASVRNGRRDMPGHEVEKTAVVRVQDAPRTDPEDEEARQPLLAGAFQRQDECRSHEVRPRRHRELPAPAREVAHLRGLTGLGDEAERPGLAFRYGTLDRMDRRKRSVPTVQVCACHPSRGRTLFVEQVERRERDIQGVAVQNLGRCAARAVDGPMLGASFSKMAQGRKPPFPDDFFGRLVAGAEDTFDVDTVLIQDRAVAEGDVDLLVKHLSGEEHLIVLDPGRPAGLDLVMHRCDRRPDLAPGGPARLAKHGRMLGCSQERDVGVVVDDPQLGPEPKQNRELRVQANADGGLDASRPGFRQAKRRGRPVFFAHERAKLAAAGEES
jgi:hypothetical protein